MLFTSFEYLFVFLPLLVCVFLALRRLGFDAASRYWLLLASLGFYASDGWLNLPYLVLSIVLNAWLGAKIVHCADPKMKRQFLSFGLVANIGLLIVIKYRVLLLGPFGFTSAGSVAVPSGISFFTLVQVMYLTDCYEGLAKPNTAINHALFVSFFPYVMMGPLVRTRDVQSLLAPQDARAAALDDIAPGIEQICVGLFKKTVFAQSFVFFVDTGWGQNRPLTFVEAWITTIAFAFELYFDFSGYSDMAVGAARLLGVKLPANFDSPYKCKSVIEFWRRWHITLSNFITTYMYTPLLRARKKPTFSWAMCATVFSMAVAGLWHGAQWTFLIFGILHGVALAINHLWRKTKRRIPSALGWTLTFAFVASSLVLFRAPDMGRALKMYNGLLGAGAVLGLDREAFLGGSVTLVRVVVALVGVVVCFFAPNSNTIAKSFESSGRRALIGAVLFVIALVFMNSLSAKEFIYREF